MISVESECFGECLSTHETTCESSSEIESIKPIEDNNPYSVTPVIPRKQSTSNDDQTITPPDPTAILIRILDKLDNTPIEHSDDEKPHVCDLENESTHFGPCGPKHYWCVLSRKHYMVWIDFRAEEDPEMRTFVEQKKAQARVKYKLEEYADLCPET